MFSVYEEESSFPKKGDKYFCSIGCAHSRTHTKETKEKISNSIFNLEKNKIARIEKNKKKYFCGSEELDKKNIEISKRQSPKFFNKFIPFGLNINTLYTEKFVEEYKKVKTLLYNEYVINCLSPADIFKKYKCDEYFNNSETLLHLFKDWNFPIRSYSKACINSWLHDKFDPLQTVNAYHQSWHTTWNNKEVYLRSSYELDYAKELDEQQIDYEVEFKHIKYWDSQKEEYRCAIPDFYLPDTNTIVEIKSDYTLDIQNMKDKFKAYKELGYNTKLICEHIEKNI